MRFLDTNIIIYAFGTDDRRADIAGKLLIDGGWISVQVLNELVHASRRKMRHDWARTEEIVATTRQHLRVHDLTLSIHDRGRFYAQRYRLAIYDSMIVAAAIEAGCDTLYSEDMQHDQTIDGRIRIVNPFTP